MTATPAVRIMIVLLIALSGRLDAGNIKMWQLKETAAAPLIVVGRVVAVTKRELMPEGALPWKAETFAMSADVEILRAFARPGQQIEGGRIQVRFLAYGPSVNSSINGSPPPLPFFAPGQVIALPLQKNPNPALPELDLIANQGAHLTIPVRAEYRSPGPPPETGRAFLLSEIANTFNSGSPPEVTAICSWLTNQNEDLTGELLPLMEQVIGVNRQRWAELAASVLAATGIPRPHVAELQAQDPDISSKDAPNKFARAYMSLSLARAVLRKLGASPETDELLIGTWIADAPWNAWGAANSLLEFGDNAVTTRTLRQALNNDVTGTSYIAFTLVRNGHQAVLLEALIRALKVVDRPGANSADLQGAAGLLRDYGSGQQLRQLADVVRKYQTQDQTFYHLLWQHATGAGNPREVRVLAVVLHDKRLVSNDLRYCDFAVGVLERAVSQTFGAEGKTLVDRDAAVSRALAWIQATGFPN